MACGKKKEQISIQTVTRTGGALGGESLDTVATCFAEVRDMSRDEDYRAAMAANLDTVTRVFVIWLADYPDLDSSMAILFDGVAHDIKSIGKIGPRREQWLIRAQEAPA